MLSPASTAGLTAAVDALLAGGRLIEEAIDDHDVLKHYPNDADLIVDCERIQRRLPDEAVPRWRAPVRFESAVDCGG